MIDIFAHIGFCIDMREKYNSKTVYIPPGAKYVDYATKGRTDHIPCFALGNPQWKGKGRVLAPQHLRVCFLRLIRAEIRETSIRGEVAQLKGSTALFLGPRTTRGIKKIHMETK